MFYRNNLNGNFYKLKLWKSLLLERLLATLRFWFDIFVLSLCTLKFELKDCERLVGNKQLRSVIPLFICYPRIGPKPNLLWVHKYSASISFTETSPQVVPRVLSLPPFKGPLYTSFLESSYCLARGRERGTLERGCERVKLLTWVKVELKSHTCLVRILLAFAFNLLSRTQWNNWQADLVLRPKNSSQTARLLF